MEGAWTAQIIFGMLALIVLAAMCSIVITKFRQRRFAAAQGGTPAPRPEPEHLPIVRQAPASPPAALLPVQAATAAEILPLTTVPIHILTPRQRQHTACAGMTGDGKTSTFFTLLVGAVASGAQVIACSTHYTDWHPEDQPIDVRELRARGHFQAFYKPEDIIAVLRTLARTIDERMERYRAGMPVGHDIALFLGEWGAVQRALGNEAVDLLSKILDEGRKTNVWISFIEYHSALVGRTGGDSALREAFKTRLAGNVDPTTWKVFVGKDTVKQKVPLGYWMTEAGLTQVIRPTADLIARLAARTPLHAPLTIEAVPVPVSREEAQKAVVSRMAADDTGIDTGPSMSQKRQEEIKRALRRWQAGEPLSKNDLLALLGGNRNEMSALITKLLTPEPTAPIAETTTSQQVARPKAA